jgi:phospho-N-acetylmuramoyl-pentapeptide-transferase
MFLQSLLQNFFLKSLICFGLSYFIAFFGIKYFIYFFNSRQIFQPIRGSGPASHLNDKKNTPTMGGALIILATVITSFFLLDLKNGYILIILLAMSSFALIGLCDDLMKVIYKNPQGFRGSIKLVIQFAIISFLIIWLGSIDNIHNDHHIYLPFFHHFRINLGMLYILFVALVIIGASNAVNLTDGLDGLVSVPAIINLICLIILIFYSSNEALAAKKHAFYIKNSGELIFFCFILIGAIAAFLKFNLKPAKIFMGDVGSLAIGAVLGLISVIIKQEIVFGIISLLFVIEAVSVILQVGSYKIRKKRIFLMAPIHHHFEKLGWSEQKVVKSFWIASLIFALIGITGFLI